VQSSQFTVVQVVRRFGEVGGMESYVWQLSLALVNLRVPVIVLCEEALQPHSPEIEVIRVKKARSRPRWLALYRFGLRAKKIYLNLLKERSLEKFIVHSHERCDFHHITTFHGPPFAQIREQPFWKRLSIRVLAHLFLERRELLAHSVSKVVPNSELISRSLMRYYPALSSRLTRGITPGVSEILKRCAREVDPTGGVVGFIGKEWRRKGLEFFLQVVMELAKIRPNIEVIILGPQQSEIGHLVARYSSRIRVLGWQPAHTFFQGLDLLIHPASSEPYGMVVAEAMAAGVPVIVSDQCGVACDVASRFGAVLSLESSPEYWAGFANNWLGFSKPIPTFKRDWQEVAQNYLNIYEQLGK
jgi:UDP-glucose:(heptosyl)LPS alpha-1,3-glucosyltransferase